ncbi:MAG TPA: nucleotidyltransferase domain-containing protein, partial [Paludibacter sp.]|nr:nucleotidyltransferase domain-containing protein [Paludibacter sp.]
ASDIDLTIMGKSLNLSLLNQIEIQLDDILLPFTFDISAFHQITNPELIEHIQRVGKEFYNKKIYK